MSQRKKSIFWKLFAVVEFTKIQNIIDTNIFDSSLLFSRIFSRLL